MNAEKRRCGAVLLLLLATAACGTWKDKAARAGDPQAGQAVFARNCSVCHYSDTYETKFGPGLKKIFRIDKLQSGSPASEASITEQIQKGSRNMPAFEKKLNAQDVADVVAYLKTL